MAYTRVAGCVAVRLWAHSDADKTRYLNTWYIKGPPVVVSPSEMITLRDVIRPDRLDWYARVCPPDVIFDRYELQDLHPDGTEQITLDLAGLTGTDATKPMPAAMSAKWVTYSSIRGGRSGYNHFYLFPYCKAGSMVEWPGFTEYYYESINGWKHQERSNLNLVGWDWGCYSRLLGVIDPVSDHGGDLFVPVGTRTGRLPGHKRR